jgi:hypothetical protein
LPFVALHARFPSWLLRKCRDGAATVRERWISTLLALDLTFDEAVDIGMGRSVTFATPLKIVVLRALGLSAAPVGPLSPFAVRCWLGDGPFSSL